MKKITLLLALFIGSLSNAQINEGFDDVDLLGETGYLFINSSDDPLANYFQGNVDVFEAFEGNSPNSFIAENFNTTEGTIADSYFFTPKLLIENGDMITFYTRTTVSEFPDRLEVRIGDGTGILPTEGVPDNVGSFTNLLLSINPNLEVGIYPVEWEQQVITISGLSGPTETRVAFRYWATDAGPNGSNSNNIGIDSLTIDSDIVLSTNEEVAKNDFFKFYNTKNNELYLKASNFFKSIQVYNLLGQEVVNKNLSSQEETINLSNISSGAYIIHVLSSNGASKNFKIIKR